MIPHFFEKKSDLRKWFIKHHEDETELLVGFYKVATGKPSISWPDSVDEALCFGWIDGVRKSIDDTSYTIRFTKRKPTSIWSAVNIAKVEALTSQNLMYPAGLAAFSKRQEKKSAIYSYEKEAVDLAKPYEQQFKANKPAWEFFKLQAPWYRKVITHWVMDAKQETTRASRLEKLIMACEAGKRLR
jgi:uncharacterized protein YdeI (YjbR/CyaY-like superfamily)